MTLVNAIPLSPNRPDWFDDRACVDVPIGVFYPPRYVRPDAAQAICAGSRARAACLQYALDNREPFGVFGGLTANQRDRLLRRKRWADKNRRGVA